MNCRPLLWSAAAAVVLGVSAASAPAGAADLPWHVTIDTPTEGTVSGTQLLLVEGDAAYPLFEPESVTITAVPTSTVPLPASCGEPLSQTVPVEDGRYAAELDVVCNGPYRLEAVARNAGGDSGSPTTRNIAVAEAPPAPPRPDIDPVTQEQINLTWAPSTDPGASGWVVVMNYDEVLLPIEDLGMAIPTEHTHSPLMMRSVRWGAEGPGGSTIVSPLSNGVIWAEYRQPNTPPTPPPATEPPATEPPATDPPPPSSTTPPPGTTGDTGPSRGSGSPAPLPDGYTEKLPYGVSDKAFVPGEEHRRAAASSDGTETASATSPVAGFVETSEQRSPGLVAPFAIAVLMLTVAAHIGWYLRRSRPGSAGQVSLH